MPLYEIEMKFRVGDFEDFIRAADRMGGTFGAEETQVDRYFNHPSRDFGETDEALRVRTIGDRSKVTYKGPVKDKLVKLREEIEMPVGNSSTDGKRFADMLCALGFREVRSVLKHRRTAKVNWLGRGFELTLDRVDGLGLFVEVETLAGENQKDAARDALLQLTKDLRLGDPERRSYLQMLLELESGD